MNFVEKSIRVSSEKFHNTMNNKKTLKFFIQLKPETESERASV